MKKKVLYGVIGAAVLFTGMNVFLLVKKDSKAERQAYIQEWSIVSNGTVEQTFTSKGVVRPSEEFHIFYDIEEGPLSEILVEVGDQVDSGTALFTYGTERLSDQEDRIAADITRLNSEIRAVESRVQRLESISVGSAGQNDASIERNEEEVQVNVDVHVDLSEIAESDLEREIAEAEAEQEQLEAELAGLESEHSRIMDKKSSVSIVSDVEGQVTEINKSGENPVITIVSTSIEVQGLLTEEQMKQAELQQEVYLHSPLHDTDYDGVIEKIHSFPDEQPALDEEANYPFTVTFMETEEESGEETDETTEETVASNDEELLPGAKMNLEIVVDRAENVPVINEDSAFRSGKQEAVYLLTAKGTVKKQPIETGLTFKGKQEVKEKLKAKDLIVADPANILVSGVPFITPLQNRSFETKEIKSLSKKQLAKYVLMGFFEH